MAGFFDLSDPDNAAMLGMAAGLLQAGMPSRLPVSMGAALGQGLAAGLNAGLAAQRLHAAYPPQKLAPQKPAPQPAVLPQLTSGTPAASFGPQLPWWLTSGVPQYRGL
jgi:hypothetical protein